jgi:1-acyl-sn-glycerol-3-phosphate acyltransferase
MRKPGLAIVECLPMIPAGLENSALISELEHSIEKRTNQLITEAKYN